MKTKKIAILACLVLSIAALALPFILRAQTSHSITISWTYTQGANLAVGFNVLRGTVTGGPYTRINTTLIPVTTLQFVDTIGVGGTKYFYVVDAQDATGDLSANSAEVSATFLGNPAIPAGVTATAK